MTSLKQTEDASLISKQDMGSGIGIQNFVEKKVSNDESTVQPFIDKFTTAIKIKVLLPSQILLMGPLCFGKCYNKSPG